jgi:poly-gamma-glutamate synthesis protein (capsule biosynthesis protein)
LSRFVVDTATLEESPGTAPYVETLCLPGEAERAAAAVEAAKREADLVIVALHWGVPFGWVAAMQDELADYQRPLAHRLVDAGADAVVGHHSHVLHGIEIYKGRPICYSLGNFVFHPWEDPLGEQQYLTYPNYAVNPHRGRESRLGGVALLSWEKRTTSPELAILPYTLDNDGEPVPATGSSLDEIRTRLELLSARFNVGFTTRGGSLIAKSSRS